MPLDGSVLYTLINEFGNRMLGYKVDKIQQPEKDEIILQLRGYKETIKLLLSANAGFPRCHITSADRENPKTAPAFCMLLRKHLVGAKIIAFKQPFFERIIEIEFDCFDELGYSSRKSIVLEIMGRHSNFIFIDTETRIIIDCIKHIDELTSSIREVLPGVHYVYPPSDEKLSPLTLLEQKDFNELEKILSSTGGTLEKIFIKSFNGMSPFASREIINNAKLDLSLTFNSIGPAERISLYNSFYTYLKKLSGLEYSPCVAYNEEKPFDFYWTNSEQFDTYTIKNFSSISEACENFYHEKDRQDRVRQKAGDLLKLLNNRIDRAERKIAALTTDLEKANDCDKYRLYGDIITASLHQIKDFSDKIKLVNYYSEDMSEIEISMDKKFSAVQNAQRYFKLYNKYKKAQSTLKEQLIDAQEEIKYLEGQIFNLENSTYELEMNEIRSELAVLGFIKSSGKKTKKKEKPSSPLKFISSAGMEIYVGKNNLQNEALTMKTSYSTDIWLHVKDFAGSHVVIKCNGNTPDDETLYEAACLAAFYSKASSGTKIPVDYTFIKNVKKPKGSKPGMVTYDVYKTILAEPKNLSS